MEKQESKLSLKTIKSLKRTNSDVISRGRLPDSYLLGMMTELEKGAEKIGVDGKPLSSAGDISIPSSSNSIY